MIQHFLKSLQDVPDEFDLELGDDPNADIADIRRIKKFSPQLNAHMMLVNTTNGKLFILGVSR